MVKKGTKAIANSLKPVLATARQDQDELFETLSALAPDPKDARLTLGGAVVGDDGKLNISAYEDLQSAFAGEPPPASHPDPERPGVRVGEEVPQGLRIWDDMRSGHTKKDGAGWIARSASKTKGSNKEKWFNIRTCGSWRLSFLLARLQRQIWEAGGSKQAAVAAPAAVVAPAAAPIATPATSEEQAAADGTSDTPPRKRPPPAPTAKATARKQARRVAEAAKAQPAAADPFAGSARFAALMAAKQAQESGKRSEWV